jgi:hypothetical protein
VKTKCHGAFLVLAVLVSMAGAGSASAQDSLGTFRSDPVRFFTEQPTDMWVGSGKFLMHEYSDTLYITRDSTGNALLLRRVLVKTKSNAVMSRGGGLIGPASGDSLYPVAWSEKRYPDLSGQMVWKEGRWAISFDGEWSAWSVLIAYDSPESIAVVIARSMGGFPAVELAGMTYYLQTSSH